MNELECVPYREPATAIEPISLDLVPDCGEEEAARVNKEMSAIRDERQHFVSKAHNRAFVKAYIPSLIMAIIANVLYYGFVDGITPEGGLVAVILGIMMPLAIAGVVSGCREAQAERSERVKALDARLEELKGGFDRLESLDRLTGKRQPARELRDEVDLFNSDLKRQDVSQLTAGDQALIRVRRGELMKKIGDFRETVLGLTEPAALLQLTSKSDT